MNYSPMFQSNVSPKIKSRSMGLKLFVVCALALAMTIPAFFVDDLVDERTHRANDVVKEISGHVGGQQTFLGPTLAVPYTIPPQSASDRAHHGTYLVFPAVGSADLKTRTEERRRSFFKVPVFQADLNFTAAFDLTGVPASLPANTEIDWNRAEFIIGVTDARGALSDGTLTVGGKTMTLTPATISQNLSLGTDATQQTRLALFGARAEDIKANTQFTATAALRFSGAQRIALLAYGKTTHLAVQGDWRNPSFDGGFLPVNRAVTPSGFTADWSVPFIARGVRAEGAIDSINGLDATSLGISFIEVADPYQSVTRSLKYILLFIGLIFLSYFIFEVITKKRVHPAQYVLVGVAQIIFYLLLLSLAERIGFDFGFLIAGAATVILLSSNAGWIFAGRVHTVRALVVFTLLYALIYMLLRLEDNALLVGAIASFLAIASAMYLTRSIDWYGSLPETSTIPNS
ncbi:MAG TPA: cell envelope integrity protein CreD [Terracidiphilus sp.]